MRTLTLIAAVFITGAASAQATRDANPRENQNTQGAANVGEALDPETKARVRTEGSAGGVPGGLKTEQQKGGASAGAGSSSPGRPERSRSGLEDQQGGRIHNETSSDREEARGARGAIR